jgi:putative membrane protein
MINQYSNHAANERTYLAWIRTAIAIMAFGFLIEKFELFVSYLGQSTGGEKNLQVSSAVELLGLGLFLVGVLIIVTATARFFMTKAAIESDESVSYSAKRSNLLLSALMVLMAMFLFFYMVHKIIS